MYKIKRLNGLKTGPAIAKVAKKISQKRNKQIHTLIYQHPKRFSSLYLFPIEVLYQFFERAIAFFALIFFLPLMVLMALLIRLDSPGFPLYMVDRAGQSKPTPGKKLSGRSDLIPPPGGYDPEKLYYVPTTFRFVKFRTMYCDAAQRFPEYYWWKYDLTQEQLEHMYYKLENDPRVTRMGKWLRKTTIDELPNFWSVLTGDIRLVGPRPEAIELLSNYSPEQMVKFTVKPGITCLSKIHGRGNLSFKEQVAWDMEYVSSRNIWLDLIIICKTFWIIVKRKGAF